MELIIPNHKAVSWNELYAQDHWSKRKRLADSIHEFVWAYLPRGLRMPEGRVDITITACFKDHKRRDSDNICAKLYIDGLKGWYLVDDDTRYVRRVITRAKIGEPQDCVVISAVEIPK